MAAAPAAPVTPQSLTTEKLCSTLQETLRGKDPSTISLREVREEAATDLGFQPDALDFRKDEVDDILKELVEAIMAGRSALDMLVAEKEVPDARQQVYLITVSHVLAAILQDGCAYKELQNLSRKNIAEAVLASFDDPCDAPCDVPCDAPCDEPCNEPLRGGVLAPVG